MTRWGWATRALMAALATALVAALPAASSAAGGAIETFSVTYSGKQVLDYAIDTTANRNCVETGTGTTHISWVNTNLITLRVSGPRAAFVSAKHVGKLTVAGAGERSEIQGAYADEPGNTLCDQGGYTGSFDCKAVPKPYFGLARRALPALVPGSSGFQVSIRAFDQLRAHYTGPSPTGASCAGSIGSDLFPGGAVWTRLDNGVPDLAVFRVAYGALARLATSRSLTIKVHDGHNLPNSSYPKGPNSPCACSIYSASRRGTIVIKRLS